MPRHHTVAQRRENNWQLNQFKQKQRSDAEEKAAFKKLFEKPKPSAAPYPTANAKQSVKAVPAHFAYDTKLEQKTAPNPTAHKKIKKKFTKPVGMMQWLFDLMQYLLKYGLKPTNLIKMIMMAIAISAALPTVNAEPMGNSVDFPQPSNYTGVTQRGVNIAGCDFDQFDPPYVNDALFYMQNGMNTVRVPFKWESVQPNLSVPIDFSSGNAQVLINLVKTWADAGLTVIVDMHNYMRYNNNIIGATGSPVTAQMYAQTWASFARELSGYPNVWFDLMNEPNGMQTELILQNYNTAIAAIRAAGFTGPILLEGNAWTGVSNWPQNWYGTSNAQVFIPQNIRDPLNRTIINVHEYFNDPNGGGDGYGECVPANQVLQIENFQTFINWLRSTGQNAFLSELNGINTPNCIEVINAFLGAVVANPATPQGGGFVGFTGWAGGHSWGDGYALFLGQLSNGTVTPQMQAFERFLNPSDHQEQVAVTPSLRMG